MADEQQKQVSDLAPGDRVLIKGHGLSIGRVVKVQKLHVILEGSDAKYKRLNGSMVGSSSWNPISIKPFDGTEWDAYRRRQSDLRVVRELGDVQWSKVDISLARQVRGLLADHFAAKNDGGQ